MNNVLQFIGQLGLIPVVSINNIDHVIPLANALLEARLNCIEITFRTSIAARAIKILSKSSNDLLVGAGTILNLDQAKAAVDNGAKFVVSPGISATIVDWCLDREIPVIPGIATPTDIIIASERNLKILKFFPIEALGGIPYLKAVAAAAPTMKFIPTGGVNKMNLASFLTLPYVHACGGSWIASSTALQKTDFLGISQRAREALSIAQKARRGG